MKNKFIKTFSISGLVLILFLSFLAPISNAELPPPQTPTNTNTNSNNTDTGLVYECSNKGADGKVAYGECTWEDLLKALNRLIDRAEVFALALSVGIIAYAGFNYMISGDNPGKRKEANTMLKKVAIGIFWMLAAYLVVKLITGALLNNNVFNLFK
jgi:hypothetical protein